MSGETLTRRREALWDAAQAQGCDGCLIYGTEGHAEAFRYLTDYEPFIGDRWLILMECEAIGVLTFGWSIQEARVQSGIDTWEASFQPIPLVLQQLKTRNIRRLATVGAERLPYSVYHAIVKTLGGTHPVSLDDTITRLRRVKDPEELDRLRAVATVTDCALSQVRDQVKPGLSEADVLGLLAGSIYGQGASLAFDPLIVSGREDAVVARAPRSRILKDGDPIMIDVGAQLDGYQSDVARTYFVGTPSEEQQRAWGTVIRTYDAILAMVKPGVPCNALNEAGWTVIQAEGFEALHRMGHGVGLATSYEWPDLEAETELLEAGMTLALEPGVYLPGVGSLKLEDMIVVTETGYELLSHAERSPTLSNAISHPHRRKDASQ